MTTINALNTEFPYIVGGSGFYTSIQDAIDAAALVANATDIKTVLINSGTYTEDLALKSFVYLASFAGVANSSVIVIGNAVYNSAAGSGEFAASDITFTTPGGGGIGLSITGANSCSVKLNYCKLNGSTGTALDNSNANADIILTETLTVAAAGQKALNASGGTLRMSNSTVQSTDTASTLSGATVLTLIASFATDAYVLTGTAIINYTNCAFIAPGVLSFLTLGGTCSSLGFFSTVVSTAVSTYWATGTGTIGVSGVSNLLGTATLVDPALTLLAQPVSIADLRLLAQAGSLDLNNNLINNATNVIKGYSTTATAAGTTTLTFNSNYQQFFTGVTTQTVVMPVTSTLIVGQAWLVVNNSTGIVTVQSSGLNNIIAIASGTNSVITCIAQAGTTAADWNAESLSGVAGVDSITGTTNQVVASAAVGAVTLSLPQDIATTSDVDFGSVTFSDNTKGIVGTTTNDSAGAGYVGQYLSSEVTSGAPVSLTTGAAANLTSLALTAGDWDLDGNVYFLTAGSTNANNFICSISTVSATHTAVSFRGTISSAAAGVLNLPSVKAASTRISVAGATTVYLTVSGVFTAGTMNAAGFFSARRAR